MEGVAAQPHTGSIAVQKGRKVALSLWENSVHFRLHMVTPHRLQQCDSSKRHQSNSSNQPLVAPPPTVKLPRDGSWDVALCMGMRERTNLSAMQLPLARESVKLFRNQKVVATGQPSIKPPLWCSLEQRINNCNDS